MPKFLEIRKSKTGSSCISLLEGWKVVRWHRLPRSQRQYSPEERDDPLVGNEDQWRYSEILIQEPLDPRDALESGFGFACLAISLRNYVEPTCEKKKSRPTTTEQDQDPRHTRDQLRQALVQLFGGVHPTVRDLPMKCEIFDIITIFFPAFRNLTKIPFNLTSRSDKPIATMARQFFVGGNFKMSVASLNN
jgi:hypothetical protein